jgi:membrane protease YdiL (CAAX protease family)
MVLAAGLRPFDASGRLSLAFVASISAADTILLTALILVFLRQRQESAGQLFFCARPLGPELLLGFALTLPTVIFMSGAMWVLRQMAPGLHTVPDNPLEALARSPAGFIVMLLVAVIAGGVREEMQRAFLLHRFRTDLGGAGTGLMVTSAAFGLGHVLQGLDAVIVTGLLGAFWGALYLARGNLAAAMISHALANGVQVAVAFTQGSRVVA